MPTGDRARRDEPNDADAGSADAGSAGTTPPGTTPPGATPPGATPPSSDSQGAPEPDARFTMANERTFLAWSRTALALVAAGLAVAQLLPPFPGVPWGRTAIALPLILLGAAVSSLSYLEWMNHQRALRTGKPLARSPLPRLLAITITVIALLALAVETYSRMAGR